MTNEIDPVRRHWMLSARGASEPWEALTADPAGVDYQEVDAGGTAAMWIEPAGADPDTVLFYIHGGGFVSGGLSTHRRMVGHLATALGAKALLVTYGYAPEHVYPAQLDDVTRAYEWLAHDGQTLIGGDSCGGWLALSLALSLALPARQRVAGLLLISPWVDLTQSGASYTTNADRDPLFAKAFVDGLAGSYLGATDAKDPAVDLLQADYTGLPPLVIQAGGDETLLDDSRLLDGLARRAGVESHLEVFPGQLHSFQMAAGRSAVADDAIRKLAQGGKRAVQGKRAKRGTEVPL
jgi:epsilon-lactone hydrolase